jgi:hypothetical protein
MVSRWVIVVALLSGCKRETATSKESTPIGSGAATTSSTSPGAALIDAAAAQPIDASVPDMPAVQRPTEAQALETVKQWTTAAGKGKSKDLVAMTTVPLQVTDSYSRAKCPQGELENAEAIADFIACMGEDEAKLRKTFGNKERPGDLEFSAEFPEVDHMLRHEAEQWNALTPESERGSHVFVLFTAGHPKYWADVLYALFAVRLDGGVAKVDSVSLFFSSQGD